MPVSHTIDTARCRVQTTCTGTITVDDILGHYETEIREGFLNYHELIDTGGVTPPYLSGTDIWRTAMTVKNALKGQKVGPRAIIAPSDVLYGMVRIFTTILSDDVPIRIFRDPAAAATWLETWSETFANTAWECMEATD
ncbi:hypothetical protein FO488_13225 [Geobacter sp. FeAm09]|uniref:hypothetical protein n=1 Tax=Geobacter sp. FeAm09 TaxID=2597769 RepID=UPI0011F08EFD|nr:hypothetical protein [Geobacter sp. FeAm09]QEM69023.1 hypothetical protein FO488_13225 [Geobacter sp. FeAm09]